MRWLEIKYKCRCCDEQSIQVRERMGGEDVVHYMEQVQLTLAAHHGNVFPRCGATHIEYVKIPVEAGEQIGAAAGGTA